MDQEEKQRRQEKLTLDRLDSDNYDGYHSSKDQIERQKANRRLKKQLKRQRKAS